MFKVYAYKSSLTAQRRPQKIHVMVNSLEQSKLYCRFDKPSLFKYAVDILKLSDAVAYSFIAVARRAKQVPDLKTAIAAKIISVSKANKIVAHLTSENANELIHLAATKSAREVEAEIAKRHPRFLKPDRVKYINEDQVELTITISKSALTDLERSSARSKGLKSARESHDP